MEHSDLPHTKNEPALASLEERLVAQILDAVIAVVLMLGAMTLIDGLHLDASALSSVLLLTPGLYLLFSDALPKGQSLGKKVVNISVVSSSTGKNCTIIQSFFRNILLPFLSILDWIFILTKKRKRLGDYLANTSVIDMKTK